MERCPTPHKLDIAGFIGMTERLEEGVGLLACDLRPVVGKLFGDLGEGRVALEELAGVLLKGSVCVEGRGIGGREDGDRGGWIEGNSRRCRVGG